MKKIISPIILLFVLLSNSSIYSQYITVDDTYNATQLVQDIFAKSGCAQVSNISVRGNGTVNESYGYFDKSTSGFSFQNGIVLTTGKAISAEGPNQAAGLTDGTKLWTGDTDLEQALNISNTYNATVLEFDFVPYTSQISFDYIFASEQYLSNPAPLQCGFTDGFAFLLKEDGTTNYKNIALVPGTDIPVSVQTIRGQGTICPAANEAYFDQFNPFNYPIEYNGQTKILKAESNVIIGKKYHIKLVIADQGNEKYDSAIFLGGGSFQSDIDLGTDRLIATNNPYCFGDTVLLNATQSGTNTYKWFKDSVEIFGATNPTYTVTDNTNPNSVKYTVEVNINGSCISKGDIDIQFAQLPTLSSQTLTQCDDNLDGVSTFNLILLDNAIKNNDTSLGNVTYYEALGGNVIANPQSYISNTKTIYAEVANQYGCKSSTTIDLIVTSNPIIDLPLYSKCDGDSIIDGFTSFNLTAEIANQILTPPTTATITFHKTLQEAIEQKNILPNNYVNSVKDTDIIYGRISNGTDCAGIYKITLQVNYIPRDTFNDENVIICQGETTTLSINSIYNSYNWSNGDTASSTIISSAGTYTVDVSDSNGCTAQKKYIVNPSAPATNIDAIIKEFSESNSLEVTYTNNGGNYEFSIDGVIFQDNAFFSDLQAGEYLITVRDKNGCLPNTSKTVYILDFPKFFTPNNDGHNDTWKVKNIEYKNTISSIRIFNRFGKLLKFLSPTQSWDGTFLGEQLPADDYWFTINFTNGNSVKSHFTLKR